MSALVVPRFVALRPVPGVVEDHEGAHVVVAEKKGDGADFAAVRGRWGLTQAQGSPRAMILVAVAGLVSDRMRLGLAAQLECSRRDLEIAYRHANAIALGEHARGGGHVPEDGPELAALYEHLAPRVHEIVCDAVDAAREILVTNRRAWRLVAEALAEHKHLDADTIAVLSKEGRLKQEDARRYA
jgi:hypothetical protein